MSVALINKKAWVSQYWNTSSDTNTSQSMLIGVNVVGGGSTNIGNFSVARTRKSVNKFVSSMSHCDYLRLGAELWRYPL